MTNLIITPFQKALQKQVKGKARVTHTQCQPYSVPVAEDHRLNSAVQFLEHMVAQHRAHHGPTGVSFCGWKGSDNRESNFLQATALMMDWHSDQFEELRDASDRLGFARLWYDGEDSGGKANTITMVIPFTKPANKAQVERIACCVAKELDIYGLIDGALSAATHLTYIHGTTLSAYERGQLLDPEAFITRTAKMYQEQDARKYHARTRPVRPAKETTWVEDDLFAFPETKSERLQRTADEILARVGYRPS